MEDNRTLYSTGDSSPSPTPTPLPPRTDTQNWEESVAHGKSLLDILQKANECLWSEGVADTTQWWTASYGFQKPGPEYCNKLSGLLSRAMPRLCSYEMEWYQYHLGTEDDERDNANNNAYGFETGINDDLNAIVSNGSIESTVKTFNRQGEVLASAPAFYAWPDLVFDTWRQKCEFKMKATSSLQYVFMANLGGPLTSRLVNFMFRKNNVGQEFFGFGRSDIYVVRPGDDDFYALLGLIPGAAVLDMLTFHARDFATTDKQTGAVLTVKTVRRIQFAGRCPLRGIKKNAYTKRPHPCSINEFVFDMFITLQNVDPNAPEE